jgi:hypothetical protein
MDPTRISTGESESSSMFLPAEEETELTDKRKQMPGELAHAVNIRCPKHMLGCDTRRMGRLT